MQSPPPASSSPDHREVRVDQRIKEALESGGLPRDLLICGAAGCIAAETRIYDPIVDEHIPVGWLWENGVAPIVATLHGPRQATTPFLKGRADLYRVTLKSGRSFLATSNHLVLSSDEGWLAVAHLRVGSIVLVSSAVPHEPDERSRESAPRSVACSDRLDGVPQSARLALWSNASCDATWCPPKCHYTAQWDTVDSILYERTDSYFDLTVPDAGHYLAEGVWHHNTGKTFGILTVLHCIAAYEDNLRILICRATRSSLTESALVTFEQEILPADSMEDLAAGCTRRMRHSYLYPSGSEVVLGGLDKPGKVLSQAWDIVYINEAIETTEEMWETLQSRLCRPGRPTWLGYLIADTNPGDPSHWLRKRIEAGNTTLWDTSHRANPRLYDEHGITAEGKLFEASLDRLTGSRRKRLRDGLWAAGEGAWFDGFDTAKHVSETAEYDPRLPVHLAVDSGPHSGAVWLQFRPPGVVVFADYYSFNRGAHGVATDLLTRSSGFPESRLDFVCTDPAGNSSTAIGPTVFEEYKRAGLKVHAWPIRSVLDSLALVESFVSVDPPELLVHPRCVNLINAFANYKRARRAGQFIEKPEDPQHPYEELIDALRGGLCDHWPEGRKAAPKMRRFRAGRVF